MIDEAALALLKDLYARRATYKTYCDYYEGAHNLNFASEKFWNAFGPMFRAFADNLCAPVVDACADRLDIVGFGAEDANSEMAKAAWELWQSNRMDQRAYQVHLESFMSGDAYVIVWPDENREPCIYPNCGEIINVQFDSAAPGRIILAIKSWLTPDRKKMLLNVYKPDSTEKYITRANVDQGSLPNQDNQFEPFETPDEPWPLPNEYNQIPVFHFGNNAKIGALGKSELVNIKPLQDALNKSVADMLVGMEFQSFPQRWITGMVIPKDPETGKPVRPFDPGADRIWAIPAENAKFGQFDAAQLEPFIKVQESFRLEIARVSRTPLHYIMPMSGQFPSGESLKTAEAPFTSKVKRKQVSFGNVWEDVMKFALRIKTNTAESSKAPLSAQWADASPRSEAEMIQNAQLKSTLGVPTSQILRELGYSEEQITKFAKERINDYSPTALDALRVTDKSAAGK